MSRRLFCALSVALALLIAAPANAEPDLVIGANAWRLAKSESGPINYYSVMSEDGPAFVRGRYVPPMKTAVLGYQVPEADRQRAKKLRWSWRAMTLPYGGDECNPSRSDSAAVVYVTWKRGLRYYSLKFVWSSTAKKGSVCESKRNPFVAQDTVVLESGAPGVWRFAEIDLAHQFRHYFEGDDPTASVPDFIGIGLMTDGDDTRSVSTGDYGTFVLSR